MHARYLESHEWARQEGATWTVGISDYAQDSLGDVVYVELPRVGDRLAKGDVLGVLESVKATSDVYCPIGGVVVAVNTVLIDDCGLINRDPFGAAWLVKMEQVEGFDSLMDGSVYEVFCKDL